MLVPVPAGINHAEQADALDLDHDAEAPVRAARRHRPARGARERRGGAIPGAGIQRDGRLRHDSIPAGVAAIRALGARHGFAVDATEDAATFTDRRLGATPPWSG